MYSAHNVAKAIGALFCMYNDNILTWSAPKMHYKIAMRHHSRKKQAQRWNQFSRNRTSLLQSVFFWLVSPTIDTSILCQLLWTEIATKFDTSSNGENEITSRMHLDECYELHAVWKLVTVFQPFFTASNQLGCRKFRYSSHRNNW